MKASLEISSIRFFTKKLARRITILIGRSIAPWKRPAEPCIRVLTYHRFGTSKRDPVCIRPELFAEHLACLKMESTVLTPSDFIEIMSGRMAIPPRSTLITIDDGHKSVIDLALSILSEHSVKAILFVCPGLIENTDSVIHAHLAKWDDLRFAQTLGHHVAPHGLSHRSLGRMPYQNAVAEIKTAKALLNTRLGISTPFFSFPFGTLSDYSSELAIALEAEGFKYNFTSTHGTCNPQASCSLLPRLKVENGESTVLFRDIIIGHMDYWRVIDTHFFRLQQRDRM